MTDRRPTATETPGPAPTGAEEDPRVRRVELAISLVLRFGVVVSVVVVGVGLGLMFAHHPAYDTVTGSYSYHRLTSSSFPFPHTFSQLGASLRAGRGEGIVVLGILLLIATPVLRVAVSVLSFAYQRDHAMTVVTVFVLAVLVVSFFLGGGFR